MKFETHHFLNLAKRSGVEISLSAKNKIKISAHDAQTLALFVMAAKPYKRKLIKHLKECLQVQQAAGRQMDLFTEQ